MKAQSVLHKYIILMNWEKERTSIQLNFLKLNPPFTIYFGKYPHVDSPPLKWKRLPPPQKVFESQKVPPSEGEDTMSLAYIIHIIHIFMRILQQFNLILLGL